jgi:hypothetical protein
MTKENLMTRISAEGPIGLYYKRLKGVGVVVGMYRKYIR